MDGKGDNIGAVGLPKRAEFQQWISDLRLPTSLDLSSAEKDDTVTLSDLVLRIFISPLGKPFRLYLADPCFLGLCKSRAEPATICLAEGYNSVYDYVKDNPVSMLLVLTGTTHESKSLRIKKDLLGISKESWKPTYDGKTLDSPGFCAQIDLS
jgi:hypothetical protein